MGKPTSTLPSPQSLRGAVPLCAPPQHRLAVYDLIAACASLAERLCNRKGLSRISVTRSFLLQNKVGKPTSTSPIPSILKGSAPLCASSQYRLAVHYLIAACASLAERLCNRKGLSRISVTRSFLLHKFRKERSQRTLPVLDYFLFFFRFL